VEIQVPKDQRLTFEKPKEGLWKIQIV
jgi:hypothetical protein